MVITIAVKEMLMMITMIMINSNDSNWKDDADEEENGNNKALMRRTHSLFCALLSRPLVGEPNATVPSQGTETLFLALCGRELPLVW